MESKFPRDVLSVEQVAEMLGIEPKSLRQRVWRKSWPPPDGHFGRTPFWYRTTVYKTLQEM